MRTRRQLANRSFWSTFVRILIFCIALYFAYLVLKPLLSVLLGIGFWLVKLLVFLTAALLVVHFFLKLIFEIDLFQLVLNSSRKK